MKTLKISEMAPRGVAAGDTRVLRCTNLRPVEGAAALRPEGEPLALASGGRMPVAVCESGGGKITVWARGSELALMRNGLATAAVDTGSAQMSALADGDRLHVFTPRKHLIYRVTPDSITPEKPPRAAVRFAVEADSSLSADVGAVRLSREYFDGDALLDEDRRRLDAQLTATLEALDRSARASGLWWMPALMAVRLRDSSGRTVMTSPPMLVGAADGACCDGSLGLESANGRTTQPTAMPAPAWRVKAAVESQADCDLMVEVLATPMLQRCDTTARAVASLRRRADDRCFCRVAAPTALSAVWADAGAARADALAEMVGAFDRMARVVATGRIPARGRLAVDVRPPVGGDIASDIRAVYLAVKAPAAADPLDLGWVEAPHSFTAESVGSAPGAALLSGVAVNLFEGFAPQCYAATALGGKAWHAAALVTFADGSSRTVTAEGDGDAPELFGPVLSYPSPLAVSLYLTVRVGATVRAGRFALRPDRDRRRAVYVDSGLKPFELPETGADFNIPAEMPAARVYGGVVAAADADLTALTAARRLPLGRVTAIVAAGHSQGAWNYGRSRFYVMASTGIYSAAVDAGGKSMSLSLLDSRFVERPGALARAGGSVYAVASGDLIRLDGAKVTLVARGCGARLLAWNARRGRLWLIPPQGDIEALDTDTGRRTTVSVPWQPDRVSAVGGDVYIGDGSHTAQVGAEQPFVSREVRWTARLRAGGSACRGRERILRLALSGRAEELRVDVRRVYLDRPAPAPVLTLTVSGDVGSGLRRRFAARGGDFEVDITGRVAPDFLLESLTLK